MKMREQILSQLQQQLREQSLRQGPVEDQLWDRIRIQVGVLIWDRARGSVRTQIETWVGIPMRDQVGGQVGVQARAQVYIDA